MQQMPPAAVFVFLSVYFLIFLVIHVAIAVGNGYLAARLDKSVPAWVILSLIPLVNIFFFIYLVYTVLFFIIDRLKQLSARPM